ncbi:reverse transcriptase domain-containing protein [Tanacetum coccineum]
MNDKSKDTAKARQDLQRLGIRSGLWLGQTKNGKCLKPQAAYSFTPEDRKKFCQFIKGVKLPDGFGSCFKHKVTDNDTNITGLKSHDCHIMMQRLLPYGLQNYLPDKIAKPIIELCSLFKQICSTTLMEDDMLKAQIKVVDILCDLELIYPPALFDIMIHLVIHLPLEALEGGPIRPRWMFPFERYMKKLKGYVQNKAKPKFDNKIGLRSFPPFGAKSSISEMVLLQTVIEDRYRTWALFQAGICGLGPDGENVSMVSFKKSSSLNICRSKLRCSELSGSTLATMVDGSLDNVTFYIVLHIDGESTEVDAPPDIIDVPGEDDDISDDEDPLPHDLADSDVEDLINDDDGVEKMADVARAHGGDGGGEDPSRPPPTSFGCAGCFINRGKGKRKPNLGVKGESPAGGTTGKKDPEPVLKDCGWPLIKAGPSSIGLLTRSRHMRSEAMARTKGYIRLSLEKSYNTKRQKNLEVGSIGSETREETGLKIWNRIRRMATPDEYTDD